MTVRGRSCPYCGQLLKLDDMGLVEVRGELIEIDSDRHKQHKKEVLRRETAKARTLEDFVELGERMGYKPGWARYKWEAVSRYRRLRGREA